MKETKLLVCFLVFLLASMQLVSAVAMHPKQTISHTARAFCCEREFEQPVAFEKTYVDATCLLTMPGGIFLKHDNGDLEAIRTLLADCQGSYILRVYTQCPLCGRCYTGRTSTDDYSCPLYDKEVLPKIWRCP